VIYGGATFRSFIDLPDVVAQTVRELRPYTAEWDSIVVTGVSGIVVGSPVALELRKPLVVVRKDGDDSHHQRDNEGSQGKIIGIREAGPRALFLDDFVSSGSTRVRVISALQEIGTDTVATYEYSSGGGYYRLEEGRWIHVPQIGIRDTLPGWRYDDGAIPF
jgi:adenine/guanine phosphoribosyltransferase-like PRPP-binding protein